MCGLQLFFLCSSVRKTTVLWPALCPPAGAVNPATPYVVKPVKGAAWVYIDHISLLDYRTYALLSLPLSAGVTVFLGSNGVGKPILLRQSTMRRRSLSHRVSYDGPLVRAGASRAYIRTRSVRGSQQTVTEFEIARGRVIRVRT